MVANIVPDVTTPSPADKFTDLGFDTQFQYLDGAHFFTARASYIYEWAKLKATPADNPKNHLSEFNVSATYAYDSTYSLTLGYFNTGGSHDATYFGDNGSPSTSGEMLDIGYSPWSHGGPSVWPWLNTRLGLQYWHYDKIDGASINSVTGRKAGDDNTVMLYSWTAF
jgi:hypothetical protein